MIERGIVAQTKRAIWRSMVALSVADVCITKLVIVDDFSLFLGENLNTRQLDVSIGTIIVSVIVNNDSTIMKMLLSF